ncbi:Glycosyl transferase family 2 [Phaeobacter piscinae]|uniref:Glycosyl transferase family 2 n=1 Tax=Phaeobacter piscinae TaxID=1580596 RepID=A0ABM6PEU2_9RHOB|nr:glycosyltransferase family 2 protein [Phaeobacter piscinae]ATG36266.1 Glycosyl transferase family 2 [Phaeobacter piscinae]AUQ86787.1 Glycosyl transferase family 2 [Phaeobacter piscinae]AUR24670.1 Glycosyl transferase family 2 [Phaeobacter piscinae]
MSDLPVIASLWIGGNLSYLEQTCLKSFADHGHRTLLYTYETVDNCPPGVELMDANRIFPASDFIRHKVSGSPAVHADAFRYKMISMQNVIWVDADVLCVKPWDFQDQWVFGWEKTGRLVCNAVLGLPRFSRTLQRLNAFCENEYPIPPWAKGEERAQLEAAHAAGNPVHVSELKWGVWGPSALTYFLNETGEMAHVKPQMAFFQISFKERRNLLSPGYIVEKKIDDGCYGVHLWNRRLSRRLITHEGGIPHPESYLGRALVRHDIDAAAAPIPDRPPAGKPTQAELAKAKTYTPAAKAPPPAVGQSADPHLSMPLDQLVQSPHYQRAINNLELRTETIGDRLSPLSEPISNDNILILTSMKNEAPFILEWIAYHKAIGAKHFLVYTNDCSDNTNEILDRLAQLGLVTRVANPWDPTSGKKPQHVALADAMQQPVYKAADWVLTIDVDEFVNIHVGEGRFADLFKAAGDPNVISFTWKFFGNGGVANYEDRPIIEQFTACAPEFIPKPRLGWGFKSMLHKSAPYTKIGVHRPLKIDDEENLSQVRWVNGSGRVMPEMLLTNNGWRSTKRSLGYRMATLNHYVLRSADSFLVKRDRGRINHTEQDQGIDYWARRNYASETDARMHNRVPMMRAELDTLMADAKLANLHAEAVQWHEAKIADLKSKPEYAALYENLTEVARPDAIYLTKLEDQAEAGTPADVQIPEPEALLLSPDQIEAKTRLLKEMVQGKIRVGDLRSREAELGVSMDVSDLAQKMQRVPQAVTAATNPAPAANRVVKVAPTAPVSSDQHRLDHVPIWLPKAPDTTAPAAGDPRFTDMQTHAAQRAGFFWESDENALFFEPFGKRLVVTFDNIHVVQQKEGQRWPWGYKLLSQTLGCSVLGVIGSKRNWFRSPFVHDSFDHLRDSGFFDQFDEVLFYGASMGAYGALTYSQCAPGAKVLAIAPQTTLDRRILPDDDRWGWTARLDWDDRYADAAEATHLADDTVVLYDPYFDPDVQQVNRLKGDNIRKLRMPFFGHQLPQALVNMGILEPILSEIFEDRLTAQRFYQLLRARRDLPRFQHDLLMKAEEKNHPKLAIQVCEYTLKKRDAKNIRNSLNRLRAELAEAEG